jgi:hypothetical protein
MSRCTICRRWDYGGISQHVCPPQWHTHVEDDEHEDKILYALSPEDAAVERGMRLDEGGTPVILNGAGLVIAVRGIASTLTRRFRVTGELVREYHATLLRDGEAA